MDDEDIRWLTFRELAAARGIEVASAIRIVRKKNWRRRMSNDAKTVRVAVPFDFLNGAARSGEQSGDAPGEPPREQAGAAGEMLHKLEALEARIEQAHAAELAAKDAVIASKDVVIAGKDQLIATLQRALDDVCAERDEARAARQDEQRAGGVRAQLAGLIAAIEARLRRLRAG
jgi:hypothetical protein